MLSRSQVLTFKLPVPPPLPAMNEVELVVRRDSVALSVPERPIIKVALPMAVKDSSKAKAKFRRRKSELVVTIRR